MSHHRRGPPGRALLEGQKHKFNRSTKTLLGMLWGYLGRFWPFLLVSGISILIYTLGSVISPLLISAGLDIAIPIGSTATPDTDILGTIFRVFPVLNAMGLLEDGINLHRKPPVYFLFLHKCGKKANSLGRLRSL